MRWEMLCGDKVRGLPISARIDRRAPRSDANTLIGEGWAGARSPSRRRRPQVIARTSRSGSTRARGLRRGALRGAWFCGDCPFAGACDRTCGLCDGAVSRAVRRRRGAGLRRPLHRWPRRRDATAAARRASTAHLTTLMRPTASRRYAK